MKLSEPEEQIVISKTFSQKSISSDCKLQKSLNKSFSKIHFIIIGITISDDEVDSDSIVCLEQDTTEIIDLESKTENEPINEQEILKGL